MTSAQTQAVEARGNVLVIAGAGTGKTRTLVERVVHCLLNERPQVSLDQLLIVTFTEAAAAEIRHRIRERLEQEADRSRSAAWWREQLALFDTAHIGTLHSFCFRLIRERFYDLALDPQLAVLTEDEAGLLANETLERVMQRIYSGNDSLSERVLRLVQSQGRGSDQAIRQLVIRIHRYSQTLPDATGWIELQKRVFANETPEAWLTWLTEAFSQWRSRWLPALLRHSELKNEIATDCSQALSAVTGPFSRSQVADLLTKVCERFSSYPYGFKGKWVEPLKGCLEEAKFLSSLSTVAGPTDPLAEDWGWVRQHMLALLELTAVFSADFSESKRELGALDFQDLERYALKLLWDASTAGPTPYAMEWREQLRFVFVDEYQDINAAQDKIIECLSRCGSASNRFLVGDIKQSIYRFRLADPTIFQGYVADWKSPRGQGIALQENFRSEKPILDFVNSLFALVMRSEMGGVAYDEKARLLHGTVTSSGARPLSEPEREIEPAVEPARATLEDAARAAGAVDLHLRIRANSKSDPEQESEEAGSDILSLLEADKEARIVADQLLRLKESGFLVRDSQAGESRPVDWRDMAVLLRAPSGKAESFAKEFSRLNIPLVVERGGFYTSLEVSDLVCLLQILDNPLQDVPAIAVLHSPLVGLSADELALIRLACKGHFWLALTRWHDSEQAKARSTQPDGEAKKPAKPADTSTTFGKVHGFMLRYVKWRKLARHVSLCKCLEAVLSETNYHLWLLTQPRGAQRHGNVSRLLGLAQEFDKFQRQGLFRFLRYLEARQEAEAEPPAAATGSANAVRLMSIHQSKGLEFPIVALADLGKTFNTNDLKAEIIIDPVFGLCPQVRPPHTGRTYPSLAYWLARQRQTSEMLGEEMRLLYVAATRARQKLLLIGSISEKKLNDLFSLPAPVHTLSLLKARNFGDWIGLWFAQQKWIKTSESEGSNPFLRWRIHNELPNATTTAETEEEPAALDGDAPDVEAWMRIQQKLARAYDHMAATTRPAKTSATRVRQSAEEHADEVEATVPFGAASNPVMREWTTSAGKIRTSPKGKTARNSPKRPSLTASEIGSLHHLFMQLADLEHTGSAKGLRQEAERLTKSGALSPEEIEELDFKAIEAFWTSDLGKLIRANAQSVFRELPFTIRATPNELSLLSGEKCDPDLEDEIVIVQGVADLVVILPDELWVVDFKTDAVKPGQLEEKVAQYEPQLRLYALALRRIYSRQVTRASLWFLSVREEARVIEHARIFGK